MLIVNLIVFIISAICFRDPSSLFAVFFLFVFRVKSPILKRPMLGPNFFLNKQFSSSLKKSPNNLVACLTSLSIIGSIAQQINELHCVKSVRMRSYSGPYSVRMRENTDQNNSEYGHFSRSAGLYMIGTFVMKELKSIPFDN